MRVHRHHGVVRRHGHAITHGASAIALRDGKMMTSGLIGTVASPMANGSVGTFAIPAPLTVMVGTILPAAGNRKLPLAGWDTTAAMAMR